MLEHGADAGVAFDGDGDRLVMVDHEGTIVDGDGVLYVIARSRLEGNGGLRGKVVGTQMTNLGLEMALRELGLELERTQVGDRYIMEVLKRNQWTLGGEPSGHVICLDRTTTGDGIVAALQVLEAMVTGNSSLHDLTRDMPRLPQTLVNVELDGRDPLQVVAASLVREAVADAEAELGDKGRVLLRPSGTEPLIRVMVEGTDAPQVTELANGIAEAVKRAL